MSFTPYHERPALECRDEETSEGASLKPRVPVRGTGFMITRFVKHDGEGALKAFCDVAVKDLLLIKGVRVVIGRHGPFVSMPRQQAKNGKWYDSVVPLTKETRQKLSRTVLEAFEAAADSDETRLSIKNYVWLCVFSLLEASAALLQSDCTIWF